MSGSREESPDWLRNFQAPTYSIMTLSSESDSSTDDTTDGQTLSQFLKPSGVGKGDDGKVNDQVASDKLAPKTSTWSLSSDFESQPDNSPRKVEKTLNFGGRGEDEVATLTGLKRISPHKSASKQKSSEKEQKVIDHVPKKEKDIKNNVETEGNDGPEDVEVAEKRNKTSVSTSTLPLVLSEKVQRIKALVECDGESIDLSGDMGAVGRVVIPDTPNGDQELYFDLKGTIYKTTIVPSRTFCVVSIGQSEAKIEAIMNDFIQLKPQSNVYEAETMVEGTLDGFSFDSEDEADKIAKATSHQIDQDDVIEEQNNGKTTAKADKSSGAKRKRGTSGGGKQQPPKKLRKKTQVSKKGKAKK